MKEVRMRYFYAVALLTLSAGLAGCDGAKFPAHAIPGSPGAQNESNSASATTEWPRPATSRSRKQRLYQGRTVEEWAQALHAKEHEEIWRAARALHILGAEGRPHLFQGLASESVHTRRICLENLTVADVRCYGDEGQRRLVALAGDVDDVRIRERASYYLAQWRRAIPAP
jgi:hypothetical protein